MRSCDISVVSLKELTNGFTFQDTRITDQLTAVHKQLLNFEDTKDKFSSDPQLEGFTDVEDEMRSMTNEEGCQSLLSRMQETDFKSAQVQLCILR